MKTTRSLIIKFNLFYFVVNEVRDNISEKEENEKNKNV